MRYTPVISIFYEYRNREGTHLSMPTPRYNTIRRPYTLLSKIFVDIDYLGG